MDELPGRALEDRRGRDQEGARGAGAKYISADAQGSPTKQPTDVEGLISKGANVLIILAMDSDAILPAVKKASDEGIPVIAYDLQFEARTRSISPSTMSASAA